MTVSVIAYSHPTADDRAVHVCDTCRDQPGSDTAREKGCTCPMHDNGHGHNLYRMVVNVDCPVHWPIGEAS